MHSNALQMICRQSVSGFRRSSNVGPLLRPPRHVNSGCLSSIYRSRSRPYTSVIRSLVGFYFCRLTLHALYILFPLFHNFNSCTCRFRPSTVVDSMDGLRLFAVLCYLHISVMTNPRDLTRDRPSCILLIGSLMVYFNALQPVIT